MGCGMSTPKPDYDYYQTRGYNSAKAYRSTKELDARRGQRPDERSASQRRQENVARANYARRKEWETYKKSRVIGNDGNYYF